jgi:alkylhydroperoxidase/carboxymuconolactone decarboxylase family protein YurZ
MKSPHPPFLSDLARTDPSFHAVVAAEHDLVMSSEGALDPKQRMLIFLAVDAYAGSSGVGPISEACRRLGATGAEVAQALRIAHLVAGHRVLAAATPVFRTVP